MDYARFLFSFKGRINRARYVVVQLVLLTIWLLFLLKVPSPWTDLHLDWVVTMVMIWINVATNVKRLHDRNRSGWWAVAVFIVNRLSYTVLRSVFRALFRRRYFGHP